MEIKYPVEMYYLIEQIVMKRCHYHDVPLPTQVDSQCTVIHYNISPQTVAKNAWCAYLLGTDFDHELVQLASSEIDLATYDIICELAQLTSSNKELLLDVLVRKMPTDYDLSKFDTVELKAMRAKAKLNLLISHSMNTIKIIDLKTKCIFAKNYKLNARFIKQIVPSKTMPLILIYYYKYVSWFNTVHKILVFDYFRQRIILKLSTNQVALNQNDDLLYEYHDGSIRVYDLHSMEIVNTIDANIPNEFAARTKIQIAVSPNGNCLALASAGCGIIHKMFISDGVSETHGVGPVEKVYFVSEFKLIYTTSKVDQHMKIISLDLITGAQDHIFDTTDGYGDLIDFNVKICPGDFENYSHSPILCTANYEVQESNIELQGPNFQEYYRRTSIIHNGKIASIFVPFDWAHHDTCFSHDGSHLLSIAELPNRKTQYASSSITLNKYSARIGKFAMDPSVSKLLMHGYTATTNVKCVNTRFCERISQILEDRV